MRETTALLLETDADARRLWLDEDLSDLCLTDDNGAAPDGPAWLMWFADGCAVDEQEVETATQAGITCELVTIYVCDYPREMWHPEERLILNGGWMGHQTIGQIAFLHEDDARVYETAASAREVEDSMFQLLATHPAD